MKVTQIVELSKSRSKVYIEQEFAFVLYKGELRLYKIKEGEEIDEKDYQMIMKEVLPKRAKLRAMNLLKSREYTTASLRAKLKQGLYPDEIIEEALAYVASYHYTDDVRYAVGYMNCHEQDKSRKRIEQDLLKKGIDKKTLEEAWKQWEEQGGEKDEQSMIAKLIEKKHYDVSTASMQEQQRMYGFLMRKGFSSEQVIKALRTEYME